PISAHPVQPHPTTAISPVPDGCADDTGPSPSPLHRITEHLVLAESVTDALRLAAEFPDASTYAGTPCEHGVATSILRETYTRVNVSGRLENKDRQISITRNTRTPKGAHAL